jgi:hypothetical protein
MIGITLAATVVPMLIGIVLACYAVEGLEVDER